MGKEHKEIIYMNDDWFEQRVEDLIKLTEVSHNEWQFTHRKEILNRIHKYTNKSINQEEFQKLLLPDYQCFSAIHFTTEYGVPFIPSPWETRFAKMIIDNDKVCGFTTRRGGKSITLASVITYLALLKSDWKSVIFAPTKKQQFVFKDIKTFFERNEYLNDFFLSGEYARMISEEITLNNNSSIISRNIGLTQKGKTSRGEGANLLAVDEFQLIDTDTFLSVISPITKDNYTEKKVVYVGTPEILYNNKLEKWWDAWQKDDRWQTINVDCWEVCDEGGMSRESIIYEQEMSTPDKFMKEYLAKFPHQTGRPYPMDMLQKCSQKYSFIERGVKGARYYMSIDSGQKRDRTQILVAEVIQNVLKYVYWKEIEIDDKGMRSWTEQSDEIKKIYHKFYPEYIIIDVTSNQDMLVEMLTHGDNLIPLAAFWKDKKRKYVGYVASNKTNYEMQLKHQSMMRGGRIIVPNKGDTEIAFFSRWVTEHNELSAVEKDGYVKYVEPNNGYKDLEIVSAMLTYLLETETHEVKPTYTIKWWNY